MRDADGLPAGDGASQGPEDELARLRAENARLAEAEKEWHLEREILRRAGDGDPVFAGGLFQVDQGGVAAVDQVLGGQWAATARRATRR